MKMTITYKNGNTLTEKVNYFHIANGNIIYTVDKNPHPIAEIVTISMANVDDIDVAKE